jgi:purine-binding chemotaxis protein CheW
MSGPKAPSLAGEYLVFTIDGESCAMGIRRIREVVGYQPVTAVPNAPRTIRGVIDLRGKVVPIIDLSAKFGFAEAAPTKWTCLIVVETTLAGDAALLAVVADTVEDVVTFGDADLVAPPSFGTRVRNEYLVALGRLAQRFALVLDVDRLLTLEEILTIAPPAAEERAP